MPTGASAPKGGDPAEAPSSRSGSGSSEGVAPSALAPGPRERRHIEHLTSQTVDPRGEPGPGPGMESPLQRLLPPLKALLGSSDFSAACVCLCLAARLGGTRPALEFLTPLS